MAWQTARFRYRSVRRRAALFSRRILKLSARFQFPGCRLPRTNPAHFLKPRFWIASGLLTIRPESCSQDNAAVTIQIARGFCTPSAVGIVFDSTIWPVNRTAPMTVISDHW